MLDAGKPSPLSRADCSRAQNPTNSGDERLVPPTCMTSPPTRINAPVLCAASNAMSGTARFVGRGLTASERCHDGAGR